MKSVFGWKFPDADEFMCAELHADGGYQSGHLTAAIRHVSDFSCAIDGGAHVGTWSKVLSGLFQRVIAVEPSMDTGECLEANMVAFGCSNVEIKHCAIGATTKPVSIAPLDPRAEALKNTGARFVQPGGSIPCERIDDWHLTELGFLKLDIEGSEPLALEGARQTLIRCRPVVLFECKGFWKSRYHLPANAPHAILESVGYALREIAGRDQIWGPK